MLPSTIETPIYETTLPVSLKRVEFKAFLAKQQKILLTARESKDPLQIIRAIVQVGQECLVDKELNIKNLPAADVEWLFLQLRIKSVAPSAEVATSCEKCNHDIEFTIDLESVEVKGDKDSSGRFNDVVKLSDDVGIQFTFPTLGVALDAVADQTEENDEESVEDGDLAESELLASCVKSMYEGEKVFTRDDFTQEELIDMFLNKLDLGTRIKINEFFDKAPSLHHDQGTIECPKCRHKQEVVIDNVQGFFT